MDENRNKRISILYLLKTFLVVGSSSFGGYSALVAVVRRLMVEKDKTIDDDTIVRGFSIASLLPGPVAVNTVTYIGYRLRGWSGALVAMVAVIFPSMVLMILLGHFYLMLHGRSQLQGFMTAIIPVVLAVILLVAIDMTKKNIRSRGHFIILGVVIILQFLIDGYWVFLASYLIGGILGYLFFRNQFTETSQIARPRLVVKHFFVIGILLLFLSLNFLPISFNNNVLEISRIFTKISLTLFGGGYVMIPMLNEMLVVQKSWLSNTEFVDAIALGQITPGPILISATFIGYKLSGLLGAIVATIGIFLPSGLLMVMVSEIFKTVEQRNTWRAIFEGLKPVVVGLIIYSLYILGQTIDQWWVSGSIFIVASILLFKYKINILWLIGVAGLVGAFLL